MVRSIGARGTTRLGETDHFIVDFNGKERLVIVYGKEVPVGSSFKLGLSLGQAIGIRELLKKAIGVMQGTERVKIGEEGDFVVDYDGKLVMLYGKEVQAKCRFKLAFDKDDIIRIVYLLRACFLKEASGVECPECHQKTIVVIRTDDSAGVRYYGRYRAICFECGYKSEKFNALGHVWSG
jgi:hypothetical protein